MAELCDAHDKCLGKIDDSLDELKDMLRDGTIRFAEHEMRIQNLEKELLAIKQSMGGWNWRGNLLRLIVGLVEKIIIIVAGMAYWAHLNGFGG